MDCLIVQRVAADYLEAVLENTHCAVVASRRIDVEEVQMVG